MGEENLYEPVQDIRFIVLMRTAQPILCEAEWPSLASVSEADPVPVGLRERDPALQHLV